MGLEAQRKTKKSFDASGCKPDSLMHVIVSEAVILWKENDIVLQWPEVTIIIFFE
jgi:hypothetical protein